MFTLVMVKTVWQKFPPKRDGGIKPAAPKLRTHQSLTGGNRLDAIGAGH